MAHLLGVSPHVVSSIEMWRVPARSPFNIRNTLESYAELIRMPFDELFPQDYLDALERRGFLLPEDLVAEIPEDARIAPSPEAQAIRNEVIQDLFDSLTNVQPDFRSVLLERYGFLTPDWKPPLRSDAPSSLLVTARDYLWRHLRLRMKDPVFPNERIFLRISPFYSTHRWWNSMLHKFDDTGWDLLTGYDPDLAISNMQRLDGVRNGDHFAPH
jgi:hypothetical protein